MSLPSARRFWKTWSEGRVGPVGIRATCPVRQWGGFALGQEGQVLRRNIPARGKGSSAAPYADPEPRCARYAGYLAPAPSPYTCFTCLHYGRHAATSHAARMSVTESNCLLSCAHNHGVFDAALINCLWRDTLRTMASFDNL